MKFRHYCIRFQIQQLLLLLHLSHLDSTQVHVQGCVGVWGRWGCPNKNERVTRECWPGRRAVSKWKISPYRGRGYRSWSLDLFQPAPPLLTPKAHCSSSGVGTVFFFSVCVCWALSEAQTKCVVSVCANIHQIRASKVCVCLCVLDNTIQAVSV